MSNKCQNSRSCAMTFVKLKPKTTPQPQPKAKLKSSTQLQRSLRWRSTIPNHCDVVVLVSVVILAAILPMLTTTFVACAKLETQIKLLVNDDELLLQPSKQSSAQHEQHNAAVGAAGAAAAAGEPEHYNLYRSELKRLSYETIHRILRDEHEPVPRREEADLRYYQKRSMAAPLLPSISRHEVVRRSATATISSTTTTTTTPGTITTMEKSTPTASVTKSHYLHVLHRNLTRFKATDDVKLINDLNLSGNRLKALNLSEFTQLHVADLSHNSLDALPSLDRDSALIILNLNGNHIKHGVAPPNSNLRELHMSENEIENLSALNLSQLNALETLDLSCNRIQTLETSFFPQRMHNLKHLNLAHNNLSSIYRETFYNLLSLNTLLLTGNNITDIDYETFLALPNLQYLDLSYNQLKGESIRALQGIPDLMGLSIAYNTQVGASMQEFVASWSLKELDASGTGLCQIPAALAQSVRSLKLTDNWLKIINCGDLDSYPLLQYLDLSNSRIEDIEDDALGRLEILEVLFLDHNYLRKVPTSLPTSLEHLFLQHNEIMDVQVQAFQGLSNLQTLDLSGNKLLYLPALTLPKLLTLNLQSSGLKGLSQAIVHTLPRLRDLLLEDNPIKCSDLLGIAEWASPCRLMEQRTVNAPTIAEANNNNNSEDDNNDDDSDIVDDDGVQIANYDIGQMQQQQHKKQQKQYQQMLPTKINLKQKFVQMHNFFEKFKSRCGRVKRNATKFEEMPTCAVEHDVIDETTSMETEMKTAEAVEDEKHANEIASEVGKLQVANMNLLLERNTITTTTTTVPTKTTKGSREHNNNQTKFTIASSTTRTTTTTKTTHLGVTKKPTRAITLRQQPAKTTTNADSQSSPQQQKRAEATNGIKMATATTTRKQINEIATTASTTTTESTANSSVANQVEQVTKHAIANMAQQRNATNTEKTTTTTRTAMGMKTAAVSAIKSQNAKQETPRKTLRQTKLQLNATTTAATQITAKTITTNLTTRNVAATTTMSHLPSMSSLNTNDAETLSLANTIKTTKQINKETTNDRISTMPQTMLTAMLLKANANNFKNNNNKRHSNFVRPNTGEKPTKSEGVAIPLAVSLIREVNDEIIDSKNYHNIDNNNVSKNNKYMQQNIDGNNNKKESNIDNSTKYIDKSMKTIDNNNNTNNHNSQQLKIPLEIMTTSTLSPNTAANNVHVQEKYVAAITRTITTSLPPTMTTVNLATTTNGQLPATIKTASKSTPQQEQQHSQYQIPAHKHEPLQLHIREQDRHLIGTPLLMHRGQNMLVENEQLLFLQPIPTMNTRTTTTTTQTGMTTTSAKMQTTHKVNVNEHNGNGNVNDSTSSTGSISNNKTGSQADILDSSQHNSNNNKNHTDKLKQQSVAKMANISTVTGPTSQNYATMATILPTPITQSRYAKKHGEKKQPSLTMKQMTITTKHTHTPQKSVHHYALNAPRENEALDLRYYKELKPVTGSSAETPFTPSHAKASHANTSAHKHSTVNTPVFGHQHTLNTFSAQQQQQQHHEALMVKEPVTKSEQWRLDLRKAAAAGHPGLVILLSFSLFVVLLVGLMHVYRCDMPWRRHLRAPHQRPHQRHFNDDDLHSFLHYQQQQQQQQNTPIGVIQKWHHSTRRHAPYSSPLHNLQVRELQKTSAVEQQQQQQQQAQRIKQAYYSAASNNAYNGIRSNSDSSDSSQTSSRSGSSTQSHCSATAVAASAAAMVSEETYYIEATTEAAQPTNNRLHSDLLPMELLNVSSANRGSSNQTDAFSELLDKSDNNGNVVGAATRKPSVKLATNTRKLGLSLW